MANSASKSPPTNGRSSSRSVSSGWRARARSSGGGRRLFDQEALELAVEPHRPLGHRAVAAAVVDDGSRVVEPLPVAGRVGGRDDPVVAAPDDQRRSLDAAEAVEEVVADHSADGRQEALGAGAIGEL